MADVTGPVAPAEGGQGGAGGDPPKQPNKGGDEGKGNGGRVPRCQLCGNKAHAPPCWRPCRYCGRRHNFKWACPQGAHQPPLSSAGGLPVYPLSPGFAGRSSNGDGDMASILVQAGNAYTSAVNLLLQRNNIKAGVQGVVGGGRVASGRVQKPASGQDSKKPPVPPGGTPDQPAEGQKKRRKPRHKTKKQPDDQNPAGRQGGEHNGEKGGDGGPPDHHMGGQDEGPSEPREKEQ
ncbi:MAG: hypothetical protein Q9198_002873 [Flavoplaca austrocitrina]